MVEQKFKVGDMVKLISKKYGDYNSNPVWGGAKGCLLGKVSEINGEWTVVKWENGEDNSYLYEDLELFQREFKVGDWEIVNYKLKDIIKPKKTIMQTLKDVSVKLRAALGEVKANQIVAGLRNADLSLTSLGHNVVVNAIADGEDAVKVLAAEADRIIAEAKKNS